MHSDHYKLYSHINMLFILNFKDERINLQIIDCQKIIITNNYYCRSVECTIPIEIKIIHLNILVYKNINFYLTNLGWFFTT
jgi:hypothetical protein